MRISLNLATRPFANLGPAIKRLRIAMGVLAVLAIALGFGLHAIHQKAEEARAHDHSLDGQITHIQQERKGYQDMMAQPPNAKLLAQVQMLNQLFDEKSFSWTLAMEDLETVLPGGVQVSTLEPVRAKNGQITIHLRVLGPRDHDVELVRNLEHSKRFLNPRITGENAESTGGPGQKLEAVSASNRFDFDMLAEYNPAAPEEHASKSAEKKSISALEKEPALVPVTPSAHSSMPHSAPGVAHQPGRTPYVGQPWPAPSQPKPSPANPGGPQ